MNPKDRIKELQQELTYAQYLYYVKDAPTMSDFEWKAPLKRSFMVALC